MLLENLQTETKTTCPICGGNGWILTNEEKNIYKPCICLEKEQEANKLKFANIPVKYQGKKLADIKENMYQSKESLEQIKIVTAALKEYLERFKELQTLGKGLYLYSYAKGSGKTISACALSNELMEQGYQVKFADAPTILAEIKRTYEKDTDSEYTENKLLDALVTTEILVIDDFGTEKVTDWVNNKFYHIINQRYVSKKVTIYTSNVEISALEYDNRIKDRVLETSFIIPYPEESVREIIAMNNRVGLKALC